MSLEEDVRQAMKGHREAANTLIDVPRREDDTMTLILTLNGLSQGIEDALALIAARIEMERGVH